MTEKVIRDSEADIRAVRNWQQRTDCICAGSGIYRRIVFFKMSIIWDMK